MPFEDPDDVQDPTTSEDILAAWGDAVRQALMALAAGPTVRAQRETTQSILSSTDTDIAADVLNYQSHEVHSVVSGASRFTVPAGWDGEWEIGLQTRWQENNEGMRRSYIALNGDAVLAAVSSATGWAGGCEQNVVTTWQAVAGDYFTFRVWQDSGLALNLEPDSFYAQVMWARWVRLPDTVVAD